MQTDHDRLGFMRFWRQFVCRMRSNRRMRGQFVCKAKITVVLPAHTATPAHQTKPPVHHAHHPEHRPQVRPVNLIVIFRPEPPVRTVRARINIRPIVITDAFPPKKHSPILGECFYCAYMVHQFHKKIRQTADFLCSTQINVC